MLRQTEGSQAVDTIANIGMLLRQVERTGAVGLRQTAVRTARRLLPALMVVLALVVGGGLLTAQSLRGRAVMGHPMTGRAIPAPMGLAGPLPPTVPPHEQLVCLVTQYGRVPARRQARKDGGLDGVGHGHVPTPPAEGGAPKADASAVASGFSW